MRAGGEARTSVWVGARASWNSCAWEMGPFRCFSILFLFFIYSRGAWRVRGINIFGRFLDSLNFFFFVRRSSFTSAVQISYRYRSSLSSFFFPKGISPAHNTVTSRPHCGHSRGAAASPPTPYSSLLDFCNGGLTFFVASRKIVLATCPGIGLGIGITRSIRISNLLSGGCVG